MFILMLIALCFSWRDTLNEVKKSGGVKQIIIEAGKEVKDIKRQIDGG